MIVKQLSGHVSQETAYVVDDYPYGFRLRCKIRYWIESNTNGERFWSQTTNPKKAGEVWNKPKASTYSGILVMGLDEVGHVQCEGLNFYFDNIEKFESRFVFTDLQKKDIESFKFLKDYLEKKKELA